MSATQDTVVVCPDCHATVHRAAVHEGIRWQGCQFLECPVCEVGSPADQWKEMSRKRNLPETTGLPVKLAETNSDLAT